MVFEQYALQTGRITLPGLDIILELNSNQYFRNDGVVDDINAHTDALNREFGINLEYEKKSPLPGDLGVLQEMVKMRKSE